MENTINGLGEQAFIEKHLTKKNAIMVLDTDKLVEHSSTLQGSISGDYGLTASIAMSVDASGERKYRLHWRELVLAPNSDSKYESSDWKVKGTNMGTIMDLSKGISWKDLCFEIGKEKHRKFGERPVVPFRPGDDKQKQPNRTVTQPKIGFGTK